MKSLAFDPGTVSTGWSIFIDGEPVVNDKIRAVAGWSQSKRLGHMLTGISELIQTHKPDMIAVEEQHVGKNAKTSLITARALGLIIAIAGINDIPVYEFKPSEIKKAVTGNGGANKEQVADELLKIYKDYDCITNIGDYIDKGVNKTDDIYDAVGINHALKILGDTRQEGTKKEPKYVSRAI